MQKAIIGRGLPFVWIALAPALVQIGCGQASFQGEATTRQKQSNDAQRNGGTTPTSPGGTTDEGQDFVAVGVSYQQEEGLSLVDSALVSYKADLVGGADCWGNQATPFSDTTAAPKLKVRKAAANCFLNFTELSIQEGAVLAFKSATGLKSDNKTPVDFASADNTITLAVRSTGNLSTTADSTVALAGRASRIVTVPVPTASEELLVSADGDIVAYPHVAIQKGPFLFKSQIRAFVGCIAKATMAGSCVPAIVAQGKTAAQPQPLADMDAAVAVLKGQAANTFPASMTQANLDALFATKKILNDDQGLSNLVKPAPGADAYQAEFGGMTLPAVANGDKPVLIVRYYEIVAPSTAKTFTYKVFLLSL